MWIYRPFPVLLRFNACESSTSKAEIPATEMYMPIKFFQMLKKEALCAAGVCVLLLLIAGCGEQSGTNQQADSPLADTTTISVDTTDASQESIYDVIQDDDRFSSFAAAIDSADLGQTLLGPGPFTVFAPTNEALRQVDQAVFQAENEEDLRDLLLSHISNGEKMASALTGQTVRTLAGGDVVVTSSGGTLQIGDAPVVEADIDAANGVVHAVGQVLSPSMQDEGF